jgi:hypothetical protein
MLLRWNTCEALTTTSLHLEHLMERPCKTIFLVQSACVVFWSTSQSQSYVTTDGQSTSLSWCEAHIWAQDKIFITVRQLWVCWCGAPSVTRGWVCRLQLLLVLVSAVILRSESRGTHDHTILSQIRDSPNLEGQKIQFVSHRKYCITITTATRLMVSKEIIVICCESLMKCKYSCVGRTRIYLC